MLKRPSLRAPPEPDLERPMIGILAMIAGVTCASVQAGISKYLTADFPVVLIVWWRLFGILVFVLPFAIIRHRRLVITPPRARLQILRGALLLLASLTFVSATRYIPLTSAIAIAFIYPFIATAMAPLILRERVSRLSWLAVITGFVGVTIVMRPTFDGVSLYSLLALIAGMSYAVVLVISRLLAASSPTLITSTWTAGSAMIMLCVMLPSTWVLPSGVQFMLLLLVGTTSALSQILVVFACSRASMSTLAPLGYTEIVTATIIGIILFGDFPDAYTWLGVAVIVASGLVVALKSR